MRIVVTPASAAPRWARPAAVVTLVLTVCVAPVAAQGVRFRRGDATDEGAVVISDAIFTLSNLFERPEVNSAPLRCHDAADMNDDGRLGIADPIYLLNHLFLGGPPLPPPSGEACGLDPTPDSLGCEQYQNCPEGDLEGEENFLGMRFVRIPAGSFMMGSPVTERGRSGDERLHAVTISCDFYILATEVTQRHYLEVMGRNPSFYQSPRFDDNLERPVEYVSWHEARWFCIKLSERELEVRGQRVVYRLPTEAEWEYACRAGTETRFWFGDLLQCRDDSGRCEEASRNMWWLGNMLGTGPVLIRPVAGKPRNPFGLHDMHGNVAEWCLDWYGGYPASREPLIDPTGPKDGTHKVLRGHAYRGLLLGRSAARDPARSSGVGLNVGFRVVREIPGCHLSLTE
jgi:formylglycine-generating enzyme required for sulfatase activity